MKKFSFLDYAWEICKVGDECCCGPSESFDRFHADIRAGEAKNYNTGRALEGFDFSEANKAYYSLSPRERDSSIEEWVDFIRGRENRKRWYTLANLYDVGDRDSFNALLNSAR